MERFGKFSRMRPDNTSECYIGVWKPGACERSWKKCAPLILNAVDQIFIHLCWWWPAQAFPEVMCRKVRRPSSFAHLPTHLHSLNLRQNEFNLARNDRHVSARRASENRNVSRRTTHAKIKKPWFRFLAHIFACNLTVWLYRPYTCIWIAWFLKLWICP